MTRKSGKGLKYYTILCQTKKKRPFSDAFPRTFSCTNFADKWLLMLTVEMAGHSHLVLRIYF
jgi:hypothetical protein